MKRTDQPGLEPGTLEFYRRVITTLNAAGVPFLLGGAYAFQCYTGIARHTKDLDLFLAPRSVKPALRVLNRAGFQGGIAFPHWLAKARYGDDFVDLIFSSGNGLAGVDEEWFRHAEEGKLADIPIRLCPVEEMIWSKSFIMERERFDGADIAHLLNARIESLDWARLFDRFGEHWRILLSHLVLFGYIYPSEQHRVPRPVMDDLLARLRAESESAGNSERQDAVEKTPVCRGTFLSRAQYLVDIDDWGFNDPRLEPEGVITPEQLEVWTEGIKDDGPGSRPTVAEPCEPASPGEPNDNALEADQDAERRARPTAGSRKPDRPA